MDVISEIYFVLKFVKMTWLLLDFDHLLQHNIFTISPFGNIIETNRVLETIFRL